MKQHLKELDRPGDARTYTLEEADHYCRELARGHYENFTVGSALLPRRLRRHFFAVYSFCRWADDLGDELGDPARSLRALEWWRDELDACYRDSPKHPVFVALHATVREFEIPRKPFDDLIDAFVRDQTVTRYQTRDQLLDYCTLSANPVGRLVLYLCGYADKERQELSDFTCTALQLTNFWQDVDRDLDKDRVYIPREDMERFGYSYDDLLARRWKPELGQILEFEVEWTRKLFEQGLPLVEKLSGPVRLDVQLFSRGGMAILNKIEQQQFNVLSRRPALSRFEKVSLTGQWLCRRLLHLS